jgi:hypothetical protein
MPRAFCSAGRCWAQANLSARSPTLAAFATILISHENFAAGSVILRGPTGDQGATVPLKVRPWLMTFTLQQSNFCAIANLLEENGE